MKPILKQVILLSLTVALAAWIIFAGRSGALPPWAMGLIYATRSKFQTHPVFVISAFSAAHVFAATFSIPGSCTTLNVLSGAVFGFWPGCAIVYPITLLSGCIGYFAASRIRQAGLLKKYEPQLQRLQEQLGTGSFPALVALRLSPFLPYGVLNPALGLLHVPFGPFFFSTVVGIFLDVVLLNSVGAALAGTEANGPMDKVPLLICFLLVLALGMGAQRWAMRRSWNKK